MEILSAGRHAEHFLSRFGLEEGRQIVFIRSLPHMDYITVIDRRERTRLSEGRRPGSGGVPVSGEATQFYFAQRHTPFTVEEIMGASPPKSTWRPTGYPPGQSWSLRPLNSPELHQPVNEPVVISKPGGLRLFLNPRKAGQIIVRTED